MSGERDYFNRMPHPTWGQVEYLEKLQEKIQRQKKRGIVTEIAKECQVNHAAVSRFFKACVNSGYIDENDNLTPDGEEWLRYYQKLQDHLLAYLSGMMIEGEDRERNAHHLFEHVDDHVLRSMLDYRKGDVTPHTIPDIMRDQKDGISICEYLREGRSAVGFRILKINRNGRFGHDISMADRGFAKPAHLIKEGEKAVLELTLVELEEYSRITGKKMHGHLSGIKYIGENQIHPLPIEDGTVRIPIQDCTYERRAGGYMTGTVSLIMSGSVGNMHMPESSALLVFWL